MKKQLVRIIKRKLNEFETLSMEFIDMGSYSGRTLFSFEWQRDINNPVVRWYGMRIELQSDIYDYKKKLGTLNRYLKKINGNEDPHFIFSVLNCEQAQYVSEISNFAGDSDLNKYIYKFPYDGEGIWSCRLLKNDKEAEKLLTTDFRHVKGIRYENTYQKPNISTVNI